ncbi:cytochrome c biogenesis protein CcdA [Catalinimonas sp. 4WD22]|uniref:protein-disulfide reductase DsbD family protein n=1 Tax=Catalinimonas locisalis TaxID=3133978 RepID=UPI0031011E68
MNAQVREDPEWILSISDSLETGQEATIIIEASVPKDWYMYSSDFDPELGPMVTEVLFEKNSSYELIGGLKPIGEKEKYDSLWEGKYTYFTKKAVFEQQIKVKDLPLRIKARATYQICSDVTGQCIPFETSLNYPQEVKYQSNSFNNEMLLNQKEGSMETVKIQPFDNPYEPNESNNSLWGFFLISFGAGLLALLTPCVFPMIPMTVTYFTKSTASRTKAIVNALIYGVSIVVIYAFVGTLFSFLFGAEFANFLSTHWIPNLIFFAVFFIFSLSFFGLFEITLPSTLINSFDRKADKGGLTGIFFMAMTLVLVGFSCTGPIAGTILLQAASGETLMPFVGMLGFSLSFAIPFTLFAVFPGWLRSMPKSGGWLNTVKVILGFLELALALKFLSIIDQVYHLEWLSRDVFLVLWISIFSLAGFYLLGKIHLAGDQKNQPLSVGRLMTAMLMFAFVIYLIPGLVGAPLKPLAGYLPPMTTQSFSLKSYSGKDEVSEQTGNKSCGSPKYDDLFELPHGLHGFFDYEQALACAEMENKPLFIDFTGHGCVNCREMEARVWSDPGVLKRLKEDYVVVALYVDDKTTLPEKEWYISAYDGKPKKSIGRQNMDFMIQKLNANAQPYYTLVGENEHLLSAPYAYNLDVESFIEFLDKGIERFKENKNL